MSRENNSRPPRTIAKSTIIPSATDFDIDQEAIRGTLMEVLRRESRNLLQESSEGVLGRDRSVALVNYLKFLSKMEEEQSEKLTTLTDSELEKAES